MSARAALLALAAAALVACGSSEHAAEVGGGGYAGSGPSFDAGTTDASDATAEAAPPPSHLEAGATHGALSLAFTASVTGKGSRVSDVALATGAGTLTIDGAKLPAVVYEKQPFGQYVLYQTLLAAPDRLVVAWLYCQSGALTYLYWESTHDAGMQQEPATGTCVESAQPSSPAVDFPALDIATPPLVSGFTVSGAAVTIGSDGVGTLVEGPTTLDVLVFDTVDCTQNCGTPGWRELHALLYDRAGHRVCFAIFYLFANATTISVEYALTLPDLSDPVRQADLPATWTGP